jgi:Polyketide cyclase / dehydrase and lipid transport
MANVDVSVSSALSPEQAWKLASDLHRFDEWLTIFGGWRSPVPDVIERGTKVSSCIKVKGFRNTIHWEVTEYDEPERIALSGSGFGGVRIGLTMNVTDNGPDTTFRVLAELKGGLLSGPVGGLVARVIRSDVEKSVQNLVALGATRGS